MSVYKKNKSEKKTDTDRAQTGKFAERWGGFFARKGEQNRCKRYMRKKARRRRRRKRKGLILPGKSTKKRNCGRATAKARQTKREKGKEK